MLSVLCFIAFGAAAQTIKGKVFDNNTKETLPSCNVYWLQGGGGTITDIDGNFKIEKKNNKHTKLVFSFTGYKNDTVEVGNKTEISVAMQLSAEMLNVVEVKERMKSSFMSKMSLEQKR